MHMRHSILTLVLTLSLGLVVLTASRAAAVHQPASGPFVVGSKWNCPTGFECKIEEVQGDWLRVSTSAALPGFPPSAIWIYAPTGQVWTRN